MTIRIFFVAIFVATIMPGLVHANPAIAERIEAAMAASDRPEGHVKRDATRQPAKVLAFSTIKPGDVIADLGAGGGYFTRLISGIVGANGKVIAQNPPQWIEKYKGITPSLEILTKDRANVQALTAEFDALGLDNASLDVVTMALIYHDVTLMTDTAQRATMNEQIFAALKPGGVVIITDHHAQKGSGNVTTDELHRIAGDMVVRELEAAGFMLDAQSDALHFAADDRTKNVFDPAVRGKTDRFVYRFRKAN